MVMKLRVAKRLKMAKRLNILGPKMAMKFPWWRQLCKSFQLRVLYPLKKKENLERCEGFYFLLL